MSSFVSQLKQRRVYRVAIGYAIAAWLAVQIAATVLPAFHAPEFVLPVLIALLGVGFPVALVLAWAFDVTPGGIEKTPEGTGPAASKNLRYAWALGGVGLLIAAIAVGAYWFWHSAGPRRVAISDIDSHNGVRNDTAQNEGGAAEQSIAVLPFDNLSRDPDNAFFASGIQDEILTRLAKIGALKVISRTSTQQYQSKPGNLVDIGKQLGVAHILEGSVQKAGNAVHINVQLIKAATGAHVWAEIYDRKLDDIFAVEGEVATAIAEALNAKVTGNEKQTITARLTENPEAYDAYLRGLALFRNSDDSSIRSAGQFLEQAVQLDPGFATAWALLARVHASEYFQGGDAMQQRAAARRALDAALRLQPDVPEVQLARGYYEYYVEQNYAAAAAHFEQLLGRWPNNAEILEALGLIVRRQGHWDKSIAYFDRAIAIDPLSPGARVSASEVRVWTRDFDGALRFADEALNIAPDTADFIAAKALIYQNVGELDEAEAVLKRLHPKAPDILPIIAITTQARFRRSYPEAIRQLESLLQLNQAAGSRGLSFSFLHANLGDLRRLSGDAAVAQKNYIQARDEFLAMLKAQPNMPAGALDGARAGIFDGLAIIYCGLGDRDAAIDYAQRAVKLLPIAKDAVGGSQTETTEAVIQARLGDRDRAIPALARLLNLPGYLTRAALRLDPDFDLLRGDARFEKLCQEKQQ